MSSALAGTVPPLATKDGPAGGDWLPASTMTLNRALNWRSSSEARMCSQLGTVTGLMMVLRSTQV
jgi:hypothetical protein